MTLRNNAHNSELKKVLENRSSLLLANDQLEDLTQKFIKVNIFSLYFCASIDSESYGQVDISHGHTKMTSTLGQDQELLAALNLKPDLTRSLRIEKCSLAKSLHDLLHSKSLEYLPGECELSSAFGRSSLFSVDSVSQTTHSERITVQTEFDKSKRSLHNQTDLCNGV